jgi:hypothetical protein
VCAALVLGTAMYQIREGGATKMEVRRAVILSANCKYHLLATKKTSMVRLFIARANKMALVWLGL